MKWISLLFLMTLIARAADEPVVWSEPVKGLRARLFISPGHDPDFDYSYKVYLQFENIGVVGSLGTIREEKSFQYAEVGSMALDVTDARGVKLPVKVPGIVDYISRFSNLCVPWDGNLTFPVGHISSGTSHLEITPFLAWDLPATGTYYLSGTFTSKFPRPNPPRDLNIRLNWEGALLLPPIKIPAH